MRLFNKFVESKKEPLNKNDIWFDGYVFKIYKEEGWRTITLTKEAIDRIVEYSKSLDIYVMVDVLPDSGEDGKIYVLQTIEGDNAVKLEEYIWKNNGWKFVDNFNSVSLVLDTELSETSENPVQNKVVTAVLNEHTEKLNTIDGLRYFGAILEGDSREEIVWDRTSGTATIEAQEIAMTHLVYPTFTADYQVFYNVISKNDLLSKGGIDLTAGNRGAIGRVNASVKKGVITLTLQGTGRIYDYPWYAVAFTNGVVPIPEAFIPKEVVREETLEQYVSEIKLGDFEAEVVDVKLSKKQNKLESGKTIKTINGEPLLGGGDIKIEGKNYDAELAARNVGAVDVEGDPEAPEVIPQGASMTPITYADLVSLRDNGGLVAGSYYRITDYITTTAQENTQSAVHPFDIIVLALSENTLAEEAYAIQSARDTDGYFANSNLAAWKLWYSLDNDTERFAWALDESNTYVVCEGDDIPNEVRNFIVKVNAKDDDAFVGDIKVLYVYDLADDTQIYFAEDGYIYNEGEINIGHYSIKNGKGVIYRMIDEWNNDLPYDFKNIMFVRYELEAPEEYIAEGNDSLWMQQLCNNVRVMFDEGVRSFVWAGIADEDKYWEDDMSQILSHTTGENFAFFTFNTDEDTDASLSGSIRNNKMQLSQTLPNNVFFGNYCYSNSFGNYCISNSFGNGYYSNSFGDSCYSNSFGNGYYSNSFGNDCSSNSFGNYCSYNSFGNYCYSNSFGNDCNFNSFGNYCYYNSFGNGCYSNSFGNYCISNSFGNYCNSNSFGNGCNYNSFGNECNSNSFGNDCSSNSFGNSSQSNKLKAYYRYITFEEGVQYVTLLNETEGDYENQVQNYRVANGTHGEDGNPLIVDVTRNMGCETFIGMDSNDELKVFCLADLLNL